MGRSAFLNRVSQLVSKRYSRFLFACHIVNYKVQLPICQLIGFLFVNEKGAGSVLVPFWDSGNPLPQFQQLDCLM